MRPNEKIKARRLELGLSDVEVARSSGLSIHEYFDIELHANEVLEVTHLRNVRELCVTLKLDAFDLLDLECAFCAGTLFLSDYLLPRNKIVERRRLAKGWSVEDLADRIGFHNEIIDQMESDPNQLDLWSPDLVKQLAIQLDVAPQILLGIKCPVCNR